MKFLTEEHKRVWKSALEGSPNPGGSAKIQGKRMHHRSTLTKQLFDAAPTGISCDCGHIHDEIHTALQHVSNGIGLDPAEKAVERGEAGQVIFYRRRKGA